jgi:integrase
VSLALESRAYYNFIQALRTPKTKELYHNALMRYIQHYQITVDELLTLPTKAIEEHVIDYLINHKSYMGKHMIIHTLKKFYEMNDVVLNWKKISQYLGEYKKVNKDRAYEHEEIKTLVDRADIRMKTVLLLLASTGIRIGGIPDLKIKHFSGIEAGSKMYKITVYENTNEEYYTFCTEECGAACEEYLKYRERSGEKLGKNSPFLRKQFDMNDLEQTRKESQPIKLNTLNKLLDLHLQRCGLRTVDHVESKRKEIARAHGFRKFFTTQLVNSRINPEIREMLLGHKIGLSSAYYRPTEPEMLAEYERAIDKLTIDPANRLSRELVHEKAKNTETSKILARLAKLEGEIGIKI